MPQYCKVGFHAGVGGNRDGIGEYYRRLDEAGIPFSVKYTDDVSGVIEAAEYISRSGVPHNVILRFTGRDNPNFAFSPRDSAVEQWAWIQSKIPPEFEPYKKLIWLEGTNEISTHPTDGPYPDWPEWIGAFMFHLGLMMITSGYKALLSGFNAGQPEPHHWELPGFLSYLELCDMHPDRLGVSLHEGKIGDWTRPVSDFVPHLIGRYKTMFEFCDRRGLLRPQTFSSEWAWGPHDMSEPEEAMKDVEEISALYAEDEAFKGVFLWNLATEGLADKLQRLIEPITEYALVARFPDPPPAPIPPPPADPEPPVVIRREVHVLPQDTTLEELQGVTERFHEQRNTFTFSHNDAYAIMYNSIPSGTLHVWEPGNWDIDFADMAQNLDVNYEAHLFEELTGFHFTHYPLRGAVPAWSTPFGSFFDSPRSYANGLHEGVDLTAYTPGGHRAPVVAVRSGVVEYVRRTDTGRGYGKFITLRHVHGDVTWKSTYAHLSDVVVGLEIGDAVSGGDVLGVPGQTGNATGVHLHFHLQQIPGGLSGYVRPNVVDPYRFLMPYGLPPPRPATIDLLPYLRGDGRLYEVRHAQTGNRERFQTQVRGELWYQTKNHNWEQFRIGDTDQYIWRGLDTSPGPAPNNAERPGEERFYRQFESGKEFARWCPRFMEVGQLYMGPGHYVQFYYMDNCDPSDINSGPARNRVSLVAQHGFKTWNGIRVENVIELQTGTGESMFFAEGYGLVAWNAPWGSSAIDEEYEPGTRPDNERRPLPQCA